MKKFLNHSFKSTADQDINTQKSPTEFQRSWSLALYFCLVMSPGCAKQINVQVAHEDKSAKTNETSGGKKNEKGGDSKPKLKGLDRLVAKAGEVVKLSGENLKADDDLQLKIHKTIVPLTITSDTTAEFTVPEGLSPGSGDITLISKKLGNLGQTVMLSDPGDFPISTLLPEEICKGKKFRDSKGQLQTGTLECASRPLCSATLQVDCIATADFKAAASCGSSGQQNCLATAPYFAGSVCSAGGSNCFLPTYVASTQPLKAISHDAIEAGKGFIRSALTLSDVTGTLADCSTNNASGCVTTSTYKSADLTNLTAGNIKNGVTIAGVVGSYPSASHLLSGADNTADLDSATFNAKIKSSAAFEWFGPDGTRYSGAGDTDITASNIGNGVTVFGTTGTATIFTQCTSTVQATCTSDSACRWTAGACEINPWHIRAGSTIAGKAGTLKTNCRNSINSTYYNWDGPVGSLPATAQTGGTSNDIWDTVDENYGFSSTLVSGWSTNNRCDSSNWTDVTTTNGGTSLTTCGTSSTCIYRDELSGLRVTGILTAGNNTTNTGAAATYTWSGAMSACAGSTYGGYTAGTWRLPTQKEFMSLYQNGIVSLVSGNFNTLSNFKNNYWAASSDAFGPANGWYFIPALGLANKITKTTNTYMALCVF